MSRRTRIAFLAVVCAQLLFPLGVIAYNEAKLASGEDVRLHVQPVDPVDFFRGEYVALTYDISRIDVGGLDPGTTVYVPLHEEDGFWTGSSAALDKPSGTFIRGHTSELGGIEFGIETYFVEEGQSRKYEQAVGRGNLYVDVAIDDDGGAKIKRLVISQG